MPPNLHECLEQLQRRSCKFILLSFFVTLGILTLYYDFLCYLRDLMFQEALLCLKQLIESGTVSQNRGDQPSTSESNPLVIQESKILLFIFIFFCRH